MRSTAADAWSDSLTFLKRKLALQILHGVPRTFVEIDKSRHYAIQLSASTFLTVPVLPTNARSGVARFFIH